MQIYPAIDIKNGQCVRLTQGRFSHMTVYGDNPMKVAEKWIKSGATYLHVVDLDGARDGMSYNQGIIKKIVDEFNVPVQTGGGIRSMRDIENKINLGVSRVILGTVAVNNPELVNEATKVYGEKIIVGIDAMNGRVATHGWEKVSQVSALELCKQIVGYGVKTIIYTDISKDGMMLGPNIDSTKEIIETTNVKIIASGGISSMMDIENIETIGVHGVIIGKALYAGALKLTDVIQRFERKQTI